MSSTTSIGTNNTTASDGRKVWEKTVYDVDSQTKDTATAVGYLRKNDSRVNVISTMDKGLKQQVYSFKNLTDTTVQLSESTASSVRVQVLNQAGQVVADSKSGMGQASKNYTAMTKGTYDLKAGSYYLVVQRGASVPVDKTLSYTVQLKEGSTVKNDYITQAIVEPTKLKNSQAVSAVQQVAPTALTSATGAESIYGTSSSDPYGLGGYNIFGVKTSA